MKVLRTKAIVLRRTNYGEADRIVQLLTPADGKISVMAKGVRREKSKLAGGIELFARCDITVRFGRGEVGMLTGTRLEQFYSEILTDYDRLQFGYEVITQINKAADMLDEPAFFELLDQALAALNDTSLDLRLVKAWFWLQLAVLLGHGLNVATDSNGMKLVEDVRYEFNAIDQVLEYHENGRFTSDHIKILRLLSAQAPSIAAQVRGVSELIDECLWLAERSLPH
ncbi:DNA repair protein RecO [Candidatus Saccharibacteria bacterium]|nr:DNA repair protein RecO [Candidatus Saccharibacteria bacterium]